MFNYKTMVYDIPKCLDVDAGDTLGASFNVRFNGVNTTDIVNDVEFFTYSTDGNGDWKLIFQPFKIPHVNIYDVCVTCTDDDSVGNGITKSTIQCFDIEVKGFNHIPQFSDSFKDQELKWGETLTYYMPKYTDEDPLDLFTETIFQPGDVPLPLFMTFTSDRRGTSLALDLNPDLEAYIGVYTVEFSVEDSDSEKSFATNLLERSFKVEVKADNGEKSEEVGAEFAERLR